MLHNSASRPTNPTLRGLFDINDFGDGAIYANTAAPARSEFFAGVNFEFQLFSVS